MTESIYAIAFVVLCFGSIIFFAGEFIIDLVREWRRKK